MRGYLNEFIRSLRKHGIMVNREQWEDAAISFSSKEQAAYMAFELALSGARFVRIRKKGSKDIVELQLKPRGAKGRVYERN